MLLKSVSLNIMFVIIAFITLNHFDATAQDVVVYANTQIVVDSATDMIVKGKLQLGNNTDINLSGFFEIGGNIENLSINSSVFNSLSTGKVILNGSVNQSISGNYKLFFPTLEFKNAAGFTITQDIQVANVLELTSGVINNGLNIVTIGLSELALGSITRTSGHFTGNVKRWIEFYGGTKGSFKGAPVVFPVGDIDSYNPVTITFADVSPGGSLTTIFNTNVTWEDTFISPPIFDGLQIINNISSTGIWQIAKGDGMAINGFTYSLQAQLSDVTENPAYSIGDVGGLRLVRRDDDTSDWEIAGELFSVVYDGIEDVVTIVSNNIGSDFGHFGLGGDMDDNPLPVNLMSFWAECKLDHVSVCWETYSETNNWFFTVEKSFDLLNWTKVKDIAGQGTTSQITSYKVSDYDLYNDLVYYRLKQTDFDGQEKIFDAVSINCPICDAGLVIHKLTSNNGILNIWASSNKPNVNYQIIDISGKLIFSGVLSDINVNSIFEIVNSVPQKSILIIRLSNETETVVRKFVSF